MGSGASSQNSRLRKAIVIKAYNCRQSEETFQEQFKKYAYRKNAKSKLYISLAKVKVALGLDASWADSLFKNTIGEVIDEIEFVYFVDFLESGKMPPTLDNISSLNSHNISFLTPQPSIEELPSVQIHDKSKLTSVFETDSSPPANSTAIVPSKGLHLDLLPQDRPHKFVKSQPLWRKLEVVRQERTVQYTTVDAEGALQELVEKEITQTEVLHMECRETGEFAHRETTSYEQSEVFNNELVGEQRGKEEYVHLKSKEDEFEYMDSTMPKRPAAAAGPGEAEAGQSPDPATTDAPQPEVQVEVPDTPSAEQARQPYAWTGDPLQPFAWASEPSSPFVAQPEAGSDPERKARLFRPLSPEQRTPAGHVFSCDQSWQHDSID